MKCYEVTIRYSDGVDIQTLDTVIGCLENENDKTLYRDDNYASLLDGTGYTDDDIYFYLDAETDGVPYVGMINGDFPTDSDAFCIVAIHN